MGTIVDIEAGEALRDERVSADRHVVPEHPTLRWVAGRMFYVAHRRGDDSRAACGVEGDLVLAPPGVPLCVECYPRVAQVGA